MIALLRRMLSEALTPPASPADEQPKTDSVPVRSHLRKKPVNAKREALHEALRRAVAS